MLFVLLSFGIVVSLASVHSIRYDCDKESVVCGCSYTDAQVMERIVNGEDARPYSWSMIVSLRKRDTTKHYCGGSILTESVILTAAHCVDASTTSNASDIYIVAGIHYLLEKNPILRYVDRIVIHPNWAHDGFDARNDIALLHLAQPLDLKDNRFIARTCIPAMQALDDVIQHPPNGTNLLAIGWGIQSHDGLFSPQVLQQVVVQAIDQNDATCKMATTDSSIQFCVGTYEGSKGGCMGDSGGPVFQWIGDRWQQVGVTSLVYPECGALNYRTVYVRLVSYIDWIMSVLPQRTQSETTTRKVPASTSSADMLGERPLTDSAKAMDYSCDKTSVSCGCGRRAVTLDSARIVGGQEAVSHSWSMVVSVRLSGFKTHSCAGTILDHSHVLTAAHCVQSESTTLPKGVTVAGGMHNRSDPRSVVRKVDRIHIHPEWDTSELRYPNDIAILHLSAPFDFQSDQFVYPTCVPHNISTTQAAHYPADDSRLVAIGWGSLQQGIDALPDNLQQVSLRVVSGADLTCQRAINDLRKQFCAGRLEGGAGPCQGDDGGPILQWVGNRWEQVGITSYQSACGSEYQSSVYTRLSYYQAWIESVLNITKPPPLPSTSFDCDRESVACGCGHDNVKFSMSKVVGGHEAVPYSWSMLVSIRFGYFDVHSCAGTILDDSHVLTAAHCVDDEFAIAPHEVFIAAGKHLRREAGDTTRQVNRIYVHPEWNVSKSGYLNDIAILHLSIPFDFESDQFVYPTCVPHSISTTQAAHYPADDSRLVVVGWGSLRLDSDALSDDLQQVSVRMVDGADPTCQRVINDLQKQFCAGRLEGGAGPCQGDDGGPILQWVGNRWEQVGITSRRRGCGIKDSPVLYTRLAHYTAWIEAVTNRSIPTTASPNTETTPTRTTTIKSQTTYTVTTTTSLSTSDGLKQQQYAKVLFSSVSFVAIWTVSVSILT